MTLPDLRLHSKANLVLDYYALDSYKHCTDKLHFQNYPYPISYVFNSRGFRDLEWPENKQDLQRAIWCIGDSFTVGIGQPFDHIWPQVLQRYTNKRTINVSMYGASNDWIYRRALQIKHEINPDLIVVMWSFTHRRESKDQSLSDEDRRIHSSPNDYDYDQDLDHWIKLVEDLRTSVDNLIECTIPNFHQLAIIEDVWNQVRDPSWPSCPTNVQEFMQLDTKIKAELHDEHGCANLLLSLCKMLDVGVTAISSSSCTRRHEITLVSVLDWARDHLHFDKLTSTWLVQRIVALIDKTNHTAGEHLR